MAEDKKPITLKTQRYKGVLVGSEDMEGILNMDIRDDDVFVCSFPRSGTTLIQEIVFLVQTLDFDRVYTQYLDDRFPILEIVDDHFPFYRGLKHVNQMPSPRTIKTHLHHFLLPEQLRNGKGKIIYTARNLKDIVTSLYNLLKWQNGDDDWAANWPTFFDAVIDGTAINCPWPSHVLQFWDHRNDKNVLFMKFEDSVKNLPGTVRRIADFLDREITDDNVRKICEYCSVENMKKNDKVNLSYWRDYTVVHDQSGGGFINKGEVGAWKSLLTESEVEKIHDLMKQLDGTGLCFDDE